jgi:hypothetical protein
MESLAVVNTVDSRLEQLSTIHSSKQNKIVPWPEDDIKFGFLKGFTLNVSFFIGFYLINR